MSTDSTTEQPYKPLALLVDKEWTTVPPMEVVYTDLLPFPSEEDPDRMARWMYGIPIGPDASTRTIVRHALVLCDEQGRGRMDQKADKGQPYAVYPLDVLLFDSAMPKYYSLAEGWLDVSTHTDLYTAGLNLLNNMDIPPAHALMVLLREAKDIRSRIPRDC